MYGSTSDNSSSIYGRIARPRSFLPLSPDESTTKRTSNLWGILQPSATKLQLRQDQLENEEAGRYPATPRRRSTGKVHGAPDVALQRESTGSTDAPQARSMRLIGNSNPRYHWEKYFKSEDELKQYKKPIRRYYERVNSLVEQYLYIDRLLDSSVPHTLIQEYQYPAHGTPSSSSGNDAAEDANGTAEGASDSGPRAQSKVKRTPQNIYRVPEQEPLLANADAEGTERPKPGKPSFAEDEDDDSEARIVTIAIYVNLIANTVLLASKIAVTVLTSSLSVLASLVDAILDFLSTAIVWTVTRMISRQDRYSYPVGRRRLEPVGVLVFSVIMITSFFQVMVECFQRLTSGDHALVQLTIPAVIIMAGTVVVKFACWLWCRLIPNSSVQALAQDAMTDVVFNIFSIIFPLVGYYAGIWPLDAVGGMVLSLYVILTWARTASRHIRSLTGAAATADERNVLLYLTMRFAKTIKQIQGLEAYHAGDHLITEVDLVLDENTPLRDSHDLGESLQYVLESVPYVDRAFVHLDYSGWNLPSHMTQK